MPDLGSTARAAPRSCRGRLAQLLDQSRQLLHLIMDPMRRFHLNPLVLAGGKEAKRITKMPGHPGASVLGAVWCER